MSEGLEAIFFLSFSFFLVGSVGDVSRVLLACVLHALGTNPAAVRGFRKRYSKARFRDDLGTSPAKVFLAGGHLFFFLFLLVGSVSDVSRVCFACLGHESGCCSRLWQAISQGQSSRRFRNDSSKVKAFLPGGHLFSFLLVGSVGDVSRVFLACVSQAFGTNPAAV